MVRLMDATCFASDGVLEVDGRRIFSVQLNAEHQKLHRAVENLVMSFYHDSQFPIQSSKASRFWESHQETSFFFVSLCVPLSTLLFGV